MTPMSELICYLLFRVYYVKVCAVDCYCTHMTVILQTVSIV